MTNYNTICRDCGSKFNSNSFCAEICPNCSSINLCNFDASEIVSIPEKSNKKDGVTYTGDYIIFYIKEGLFKVLGKDSHFHVASQNINNLLSDSSVRFYTKDGATAAIEKMKERSPDWDLKSKKIR